MLLSLYYSILLHPKSSRGSLSSVTALWAVGLRWVQPSVLFVIMIIPFTHPSLNSVPPLRFMFPIFVLFHVSDLRFVSCFHSIFDPRTPNLTLTYPQFSLPWYVLFGTYTFQSSCMFLSLKSTLIVPQTHCPNLQTLVCPSPKIRGQ